MEFLGVLSPMKEGERRNIMSPRILSIEEKQLCEIYFNNAKPQFLNANDAAILASLKSHYEFDGMLSDKQLSLLKSIKYRSDMAKRSDAIAKGRPRFFKDIARNTDRKLNGRFNNIGRN